MCFAPRRCALFRHLKFQKWSDAFSFWHFWLGNVLRATTACTFFDIWRSKRCKTQSFFTFDLEMCFAPQRRALFRHLNFQKVVRTWRALYILTWKCASSHRGVHFFDISTSKSGPNVRCVLRATTPCTFFDSSTSKSGPRSAVGVFCTFWLGNVLRATTACNCSSLIWPAGSARAALARLLFHPGAPNHCESWLSYLFAHLHLLASHSFSSLIFSLLFFSSLTLPTSAFPTVHIVGSFTSKLPSII